MDRLLVWPQFLLPQAGLSALARRASRCRLSWFKNPFIRLFVRLFRVDLAEAESPDPADYPCFNSFFTRPLKPGARPVADPGQGLACPCDGRISQVGRVRSGRIFQAKGQEFSAAGLLGCPELARNFTDGHYATFYLSPRDYHRVHMPTDAVLETEIHVPGRLFSVNERTSRHVDRLFARNERLSLLFRSPGGRPLGLVMVAAMLVSGIETAWAETEYRRTPEPARIDHARAGAPVLLRGAELGRFNWGSTVIVLMPPEAPGWSPELAAGTAVRLGQPVTTGTFDPPAGSG